MRRPWKLPSKERTDSFGVPGAWLSMQDSLSSGRGGPPRWRRMYHMNAALNAFSLLQEPHIMVDTMVMPRGATAMRVSRTRSGQSMGGRLPSAARWASTPRFSGAVNTLCSSGWL